jgi:hypothetical protein
MLGQLACNAAPSKSIGTNDEENRQTFSESCPKRPGDLAPISRPRLIDASSNTRES